MASISMRYKMYLAGLLSLHLHMMDSMFQMLLLLLAWDVMSNKYRATTTKYLKTFPRQCIRSMSLGKMVFVSDKQSIENCRMDRKCFTKLCHLLKSEGRLETSKNMSVEETLVSFLHILAHHTKKRVVKHQLHNRVRLLVDNSM
ncbi:hypothetical protein PTKIN_Ptkin19aG0038200 [Pterospermum kingtungense]